MTLIVFETFVTFVGTALMLGLAFKFAWNAQKLNREKDVYDASYDILLDFYESADVILNDPASPESLKTALADISLLLNDNESGATIFKKVISDISDEKRENQTPNYMKQLDELQKSRPDIYRNGIRAINSGMMSFMLIYGQEHPQVEIKATRLASDPNKSASLMSKLDNAIGSIKNNDNGINNGLAPV